MLKTILLNLAIAGILYTSPVQAMQNYSVSRSTAKEQPICLYKDDSGKVALAGFDATIHDQNDESKVTCACYSKKRSVFFLGFSKGQIQLQKTTSPKLFPVAHFKDKTTLGRTGSKVEQLSISPDESTVLAVLDGRYIGEIKIKESGSIEHIKVLALNLTRAIKKITWAPDSSFWCAQLAEDYFYFHKATQYSSLMFPANNEIKLISDEDEVIYPEISHKTLLYYADLPIRLPNKHLIHKIKNLEGEQKLFWELTVTPEIINSYQLERHFPPRIHRIIQYFSQDSQCWIHVMQILCPKTLSVTRAEQLDDLVVFTFSDGSILTNIENE